MALNDMRIGTTDSDVNAITWNNQLKEAVAAIPYEDHALIEALLVQLEMHRPPVSIDTIIFLRAWARARRPRSLVLEEWS